MTIEKMHVVKGVVRPFTGKLGGRRVPVPLSTNDQSASYCSVFVGPHHTVADTNRPCTTGLSPPRRESGRCAATFPLRFGSSAVHSCALGSRQCSFPCSSQLGIFPQDVKSNETTMGCVCGAARAPPWIDSWSLLSRSTTRGKIEPVRRRRTAPSSSDFATRTANLPGPATPVHFVVADSGSVGECCHNRTWLGRFRY